MPQTAAVRRPRNRDAAGRKRAYDHMAPLLIEYATLPPEHARRSALRDELVRGYLPVARHIARRFGNRGEPTEDLIQVASLGLIFAIDRFRPELGYDFLAYAVPTIRGEVRRHLRDRVWSLRVSRRLKDLRVSVYGTVAELSQRLGRAPRSSEIAELLGVDEVQVLEVLEAATAYRTDSLDRDASPLSDGEGTLGDCLGALDPALESVEDREALEPLVAALPDRERDILVMRFYGNLTQTQISERIGISQMHVSRLLTRTLGALKEGLLCQP